MFDEGERKAVALEYVRRINAGDVDELIGLFASDIRFEDPVGSVPIHGTAAVRQRLAQAIDCRVHEEPGTVSGSHDGQHIATPVTVFMDDPGGKRMRIGMVSVFRLNSSGLIDDVRVFWGKTDVTYVDRADPESD